MIPIKKSNRDKLQSNLDINISEIKGMNEHIADMIAKMYDIYDKKIEKQLQPMSVQITKL